MLYRTEIDELKLAILIILPICSEMERLHGRLRKLKSQLTNAQTVESRLFLLKGPGYEATIQGTIASIDARFMSKKNVSNGPQIYYT